MSLLMLISQWSELLMIFTHKISYAFGSTCTGPKIACYELLPIGGKASNVHVREADPFIVLQWLSIRIRASDVT